MSDATPTATGVIRLGYHGSLVFVTRILRAAGCEDDAMLSQYDIADPFRAVRAGELDAMVVKFGLREPDLETSEVLALDARAAVMGAGHPLASRASVSIE